MIAVIGKNYTESHRHAQDVLGLERGSYQIIMSPDALRTYVNNPGNKIYVAPDALRFHKDRFALQGLLKYARSEVVYGQPEPVKRGPGRPRKVVA